MAIFAQEILEDGYPAKTIVPIEKPLTTYELLPYPIALSIKLFSSSDFAVRLPAAIFGALTTCLIFYMGLQLSGVWVAILAAAIHACSPFSILWGGKAFHPQQTQFFALLTSYLFYRSISHESNAIEPKFLYGASLCFILTYLTWEGSGLLLPSFFCALLVIKGKDLSWLKCKHLWLAVCIVGMAVSLQLSRRIVLNFPYIVVGKGLSDAGFTLFFLSPSYDPWFYMQYFLFAGNHFIMTVLVILGGPLVLTNRDIRFYYSLMIVLLVLLTNFIPNLSTRYAYFIQPYLILTASLIMIHFIISVYRSQKIILFYVHIVTKYLCLFAFPLTMFLSTNTMMLHLYRLGKSPEWIIQMLPDIYGIDYRSTSRFLKNVLRQDATVISVMPHTLEYYGNWKSNYYLQSYTNRQILYDVSDISNNYLDKYIGAPVIRNISELNDIMNRHRTVYIVATPYAEIQSTNDKPILEFIAKNSRIVYESYRTRIYLWRR